MMNKIMTKDEVIKSFMKDIEDLKLSVDQETFEAVIQSFAGEMMGMPIFMENDV